MGAHDLRAESGVPVASAAAPEPFVYYECAADLGLLHLVGRRPDSGPAGEVPDLRLETMVSATEAFGALVHTGSPSDELTTMWSCCRRSPKSIVEIAVSLRLSYLEVRALVREAVSKGLLLVHPDACGSACVPLPHVVARLRHGLLALE